MLWQDGSFLMWSVQPTLLLTDPAILQTAPIYAAPLAPQPRAVGDVVVTAKATPRGSMLDDLRQSGAMKALFPRPSTDTLEVILINTAGGLTGGDRFTVTAAVASGARMSLTTQAAERAYKAQPREVARSDNRLRIANGGRIDWLPQETILYDACALHRRMVADLAPGATLLFAEPLIFGRAAMGETLRNLRFRDLIDIRRDGLPLYLDAVHLEGDVTARLARPHVANGAGALASVVYVGADAEAHLGAVRDMLPDMAGASLIGGDVLVARILASDGFALRCALIPILQHLSQHSLPRSWKT